MSNGNRFCHFGLIPFVLTSLIPMTGWAHPPDPDRAAAEAFYRAGSRHFDQGHFKSAAESYAGAVAEDPDFVEAYYNLALASEMVDRQRAIEFWRRYVEVVTRLNAKHDLSDTRARIQTLEARSDIPKTLRPDRYKAKDGDYYRRISWAAEPNRWNLFPIRVFLGHPPISRWKRPARRAFDNWAAVIPMELVESRFNAEIVVGWSDPDFDEAQVSWEEKSVTIYVDTGRYTAPANDPLAQRPPEEWPDALVQAFVAHQLGHSLGITGHSDDKNDVMFSTVKGKSMLVGMTNDPGAEDPHRRSGSRVSHGAGSGFANLTCGWKPSQKDKNTLIRLYNHAGPAVRLR